MRIQEVDQETLDLIDEYNDLTDKWFKGIEWLAKPNLTKIQEEKGEERLTLRLKQLSIIYDKLKQKGVPVIAEEYIDTSKYVLKPPF